MEIWLAEPVSPVSVNSSAPRRRWSWRGLEYGGWYFGLDHLFTAVAQVRVGGRGVEGHGENVASMSRT